MPRRARQVAGTGIYHVMLRGVNRDPVFLEDEDRERFLRALEAAKEASDFRLLAYCLMDNHVHLVIRTGTEPLGDAVRRIGVRYAPWFNKKYGRAGHLFQDRFKSVPVEDDAHLITLLRYVWNNPVEAGIVVRSDDYHWSSRRLFGGSGGVVDADVLDGLLPGDPLTVPTESAMVPVEQPLPHGPRPRYSDDQVLAFLEQACGADSPECFLTLDRESQKGAIRDLRTRSVSFAQLAKLTGLSATSLKRMHAVRATPG
jgi:REP element-mobilizing transposase RayT